MASPDTTVDVGLSKITIVEPEMVHLEEMESTN